MGDFGVTNGPIMGDFGVPHGGGVYIDPCHVCLPKKTHLSTDLGETVMCIEIALFQVKL